METADISPSTGSAIFLIHIQNRIHDLVFYHPVNPKNLLTCINIYCCKVHCKDDDRHHYESSLEFTHIPYVRQSHYPSLKRFRMQIELISCKSNVN